MGIFTSKSDDGRSERRETESDSKKYWRREGKKAHDNVQKAVKSPDRFSKGRGSR